MRRFTAAFLSLIIVLSLAACGEKPIMPERIVYEDIAIIYTNDTHCALEGDVGFSSVAALKEELTEEGKKVILADVGDAVQGSALGMMSSGRYIVELMNKVGYDVATFGNHEFDYGMDALKSIVSRAEFEYVSANLNIEGKLFVKPYKIFTTGERKVAFVGITTPTTLLSLSPNNFYDSKTNEFANFMGGNNGEFLYESVQKAVDAAKEEGADYVIALSHLGNETQCFPWRAVDVIENTCGIDAFLDAHEHSVIESEKLTNKNGESVIRSSTGAYFQNVGILSISPEGEFSARLVKPSGKSEKVNSAIDEIKAKYSEILSEKIGKSDIALVAEDEESGEKTIRKAETNLGNLAADAIRNYTNADVAIINGSAIKGKLDAGDISYGDICRVFPGSEIICTIKVKGSQLIDALEFSVRNLPDEISSFLQVSGISFEVDTKVPSPVKIEGERSFAGVNGYRRVKNIKVNGKEIAYDGEYILAGTDYMLKSFNNGYEMFRGCEAVPEDEIPMSAAIKDYIKITLGGEIGEEYAEAGKRIVIK